MKKNIVLVLLLVVTSTIQAQVVIGKETPNGNSALLDFGDSSENFRGIILPAVDNYNSALSTINTANNGTFLFDKSDNKLKMYENEKWVELSEEGDASKIQTNPSIENDQQQGVIIGAGTTDAKGIMILESSDKALILPKIANPHLTIKNPYAGMICYDTVSKTFAAYDGLAWNYWK